ncbi:hypothetical protein ACOKM5_20780 [Streptomyces sp. BH097]|uniref:hypothetical protein n=1 Tax=Streptomyces sp. BH097 TaxID=3410406 RepID=UPI003CEF2717
MTDIRPGPDKAELDIAASLRKMGVGPDAEPPPLPAAPAHLPPGYAAAPDDWFTKLYGPHGDSPIEAAPPARKPGPEDEPDPEDEPEAEGQAEAEPEQDAAETSQKKPRRALVDVLPAHRLRWLALHSAAAAAGWPIGLVAWGRHTAAWFAAGNWTAPSAWALYFLGVAALGIYRRTRRSALLIAWLGAIPVSSITLGVLLYGRAA